MTGPSLSARLRRRALDEGFDVVRIARAAALPRDAKALTDWLAAGYHAGMGWMAREPDKRSDPDRLLPGCRSVVVLGMNYWTGDDRPDDPGSGSRVGRVARYARGRDYHKVLGRKLRKLSAWLVDEAGDGGRAFVDTGPVLERAWAERAGLGWIGKNANLLTREMGSWLLLGELLTTVALQPDPGPHDDHCGSCTACLDACPTDAIVAPGQVDSNACISYWTIEHRGPVPASRREGIGDWIFGCDVCQDVCPWNLSFARVREDDPFAHAAVLDGLDPEEILALDEARFREVYSGTPLMRAKWEGMRRNACMVLGNRRAPESLPALIAALDDPDPVVRSHAGWAIGRIGGRQAAVALAEALAGESDPIVGDELRLAGEAASAGDPPVS